MFAHNIEECLELIKKENERKDNTISYLREELRKLKEEYNKDEEIQKMQEQLEEMKKEYYRGFPISEKEQKRIETWKKKHDEETHGVRNDVPSYDRGVGGRYEYIFYPTGIGVSGVVRCYCGAEYEFQEIY